MSDLISRQAAIDAVEESRRFNPHEDSKVARNHEYEHIHFLKILHELPPVQPDPCDVCKWYDDIDCTACVACPARGIE